MYLNFLIPQVPKMCDPILVTLMKMRLHNSQSSRENTTLSSGTSPLAYYQEVPLPPGKKRQVDRPGVRRESKATLDSGLPAMDSGFQPSLVEYGISESSR